MGILTSCRATEERENDEKERRKFVVSCIEGVMLQTMTGGSSSLMMIGDNNKIGMCWHLGF
jgi:hypothetical protein